MNRVVNNRIPLSFRLTSNPDNLSREDILKLIKFCPICGTEWPEQSYICANIECGTKVRIEPGAYNWYLFYPKHNGWAYLERRLPKKEERIASK